MIYSPKYLRVISLSLSLIIISSSFPALGNESRIFKTKNAGKLAMVAMLSLVGLVVKYLNHKDNKTTACIRDKFELPTNVLELRKGFDVWKLEIYEDRIFIFRNGVLYKSVELSEFSSEN